MSLKDLDLKASYDSDEEDILNGFYIPALSQSITYKRLAGFFTSNSLAIAAKGISKFIINGGKIQLIANVVLSKEDYEKIKEVSEKPFLEKAEQEFIDSLDRMEDQLISDHVKMLGWMLKNNKIELKISLVQEGNGIQHQKTGVLQDNEGNIISFTGSDNETKKGWIDNIENFHVFCNWREGDKEHINADIGRFDKFWNNEGKRSKVFSISSAVENNLIRIAPKNDKEFEKLTKKATQELLQRFKDTREKSKKGKVSNINLRDYQKEAIKKWVEGNYRGIFEMATGTGKTYTAIGCLKDILIKENDLIAVIAAPYGHLITQWKQSIENSGIEEKIIVADGSNTKWRDEFIDTLTEFELGRRNKLVILTTYNTLCNDFFINLINSQNHRTMLIADEMHWSGAEEFRKGLIEKYTYRLGLSATPNRYFDDAGSKFIIEYFGGTVYSFDLKRAIAEINPDTGKSYLTPYEYYPFFVELSEEEYEKYELFSKKISRQYAISKNRKEKDELLQRLLEKRQRIIVDCPAKYIAFNKILDSIEKNLNYCLVYCSDAQINETQEILKKRLITNHRFTGDEGIKPSKKYDGKSERQFILDQFGEENPTFQILVAMKCLDEGVDVPAAHAAIILASSGNPKQYIQRRGRILRRSPGKDKAVIYDILVLPPAKKISEFDDMELEKKILRKELQRYEEFAKISLNLTEALNIIFPIKRRYGIL